MIATSDMQMPFYVSLIDPNIGAPLFTVVAVIAALVCVVFFYQSRSGGPIQLVRMGCSLLVVFLSLQFLYGSLVRTETARWLAHYAILQKCISGAILGAVAFTTVGLLKRFVFFGRDGERGDSRAPLILVNIVDAAIYVCTGLIIYAGVFGRDISGIAVTSGVLAFVIGYSAQTTLVEVFSGLALNFSRPFQKGDFIQMDGITAYVTDMGWRSVQLRTRDQLTFHVPNSGVAKLNIENYGVRGRSFRQKIHVDVDVAAPPARVREIGARALAAVPAVLSTPPPMLRAAEFSKYGVAYTAYYWIDDYDAIEATADAVVTALWYALTREGIALANRHRLRDRTPLPAVVCPSALVGQTPLLEALGEADREALARQSHRRLYGPHECIVRRGEPGSSLFLIVAGEVDVHVAAGGDTGAEVKVATLSTGQSFGEMSLITGEPRSATVRARGEVELIEIQKDALEPILRGNPSMVEAIASNVVSLKQENDARQAEALRNRSTQAEAPSVNSLARRIRQFFALAS